MNQTQPDLAAAPVNGADSSVAQVQADGSLLMSGEATAATFLDQGGDANASIGIPDPDPFFAEDSFAGQEFGWGGYFQALAAVFLLLGLLYLMVHLLRRLSGKGSLRFMKRNQMQIEGQLSLGPKRSLVVVRFLNKRLVLGVTDSQINLLESMEAGHDENTETFSKVLDTAHDPDDSD